MATTSTYQFKTLKERALTLGSAAVGMTAFGIGLSAVFNPVALAAVGVYATYQVGASLLLPIPAYRNWAFNQMVKKGHAELVSENTDIFRLTKEVSDSLGRPVPPKIYAVNTAMVAKMAFPLGLRWLEKIGPVREFISKEAMPKVFAAIPGANTMLTTKEALAATPEKEQMRFIVAHEMSHLQTDALSPALYGKAIVKKMSEPLLLAAGAALILSAVGVGLPVAAIGVGALAALKAGAALLAIKYVSNAAINFGMRLVETRADRNGLYITRDLESAKKVMDFLHEPKQRKPVSPLREAVLDHPSYLKRVESLTTSFNAVSKYPPLAPVNDNSAPKPQEQTTKLAM